MAVRTHRFFVCDTCGRDSRQAEYESHGFVSIRVADVITGIDVLSGPDHHLCSKCWCRVQDVIDPALLKNQFETVSEEKTQRTEYRSTLIDVDPFTGEMGRQGHGSG